MPFIKSTYEYTKIRKTFGRECLFQDVPAQMLDSIEPNKAHQSLYILRNPVNRAVQATLPQSHHDANTKIVVKSEASMNHVEGGWPKEVHADSEDHVTRYRRRIMHEENYAKSIQNSYPTLKHCIDQNNAIELYESYFHGMKNQEPVENYSIRIANDFRDKAQRPVSCIVWTKETNSKLAVAYSFKTFEAETGIKTFNECYIWDVNDQTEPLVKLQPVCSCWQLACSPADPDILITGLENGTVSVHDIREGTKSVANSSIYNSHRGPVTSLLYTHTRINSEFFTGSTDGNCLWWDCRNLSEPSDSLPMSIKISPREQPHLGNAEGVSRLEYDNGMPTKFLCGTESGLVININRMGKTHFEKLYTYWNAHIGPVRAVKRSPCTFRMFLTCGDSTVRIWSEEVRSAPIIVNNPYRYEVMDAIWAPLRYSCYMSICAGGFFYYWDILRKCKEPIATLQISKNALTFLCPHSEGHSVAIGDSKGVLHLVQLSENMVEPGNRDKALVSQIYERQTHREHNLETRIKEIRLKNKNNKEATRAGAEEISEEIQEEEEPEVAAEAEYFRIVNEELRNMKNTTSTASLHY